MAAAEGPVAEFSSFANFEEKKRKSNFLMSFPKTGTVTKWVLLAKWESWYFRIYAPSHQHILKKQNVFCNFQHNWYKRKLLAFAVRSIQAAKSSSCFCSRKKPCRKLRAICQALLASKFGKWELILDLQNLSSIICHVYLCTRCKRTFTACILIKFSRTTLIKS